MSKYRYKCVKFKQVVNMWWISYPALKSRDTELMQ